MVCIKGRDSMENILWLQWIAAMGAMVMLFTLGLNVGWTSPYLAKLTAANSSLPMTLAEASWVSSLLNFGRFFGALIGGFSVQFFDSKRTLVFIGFPLILGWIGIIAADSVIWLCAARLAAGISLGMSFSSFPIFLGEISSPKIRGALVSLAMTGMNFGALIGNIMGAYLSMTTFCYVSLVPNVAFILLFLWIPQSPHNLIRTGKIEDAEESIVRYNPNVNSKLEVEVLKEFVMTSGTVTFKDRLREFNTPRNRKAGITVLVLYFFTQFSGINTAIFSMENILISAKFTVIHPSTGVIIASTIGVVSGWISIYLADKFSRKSLMIVSSAGVAMSMMALGTHFALVKNGFDPNAFQWLPITSLIAFEIFVCNGVIGVPNMILSELFAPNIKTLAACIASIFLGLSSFAAAKSYQPAVDAIGEANVFWIHALIMLMCIFFSAIFLPETRGKTLREIQEGLVEK